MYRTYSSNSIHHPTTISQNNASSSDARLNAVNNKAKPDLKIIYA